MTSRSLSTTRNRIFMSVEETSTGHGVVFAAVTTEILMARIRIVMITACLFIARPFHPSLSFFDHTNSTIFRSFFPIIFKHFFISLPVTVYIDLTGIILLEMSTFFPHVLKHSFRFSLLAIYIYFYSRVVLYVFIVMRIIYARMYICRKNDFPRNYHAVDIFAISFVFYVFIYLVKLAS